MVDPDLDVRGGGGEAKAKYYFASAMRASAFVQKYGGGPPGPSPRSASVKLHLKYMTC